MISESLYQKLKADVEQLEKKREQAIGMQQQLQETLKKEFGCKTLIQARNKLKKLKKEKKENEKKFWEEYRLFKLEYKQYCKKLEASSRS